jgi:hypothetical protein
VHGRGGCLGLGVLLGSLCESMKEAVRPSLGSRLLCYLVLVYGATPCGLMGTSGDCRIRDEESDERDDSADL